MGWELIVVMVVPLVVGLASWWTPAKLSRVLSLASGLLSFVLALTLIPARSATALSGWLRVDALSVVFMVTVAFLYMTTAVFAAGDLRPGGDKRYLRRFFAGFNLFAWAMLMATAVNGFALLWVAIEITTIISALLVAIEGTDTATEAAWKYVVIASMGLGIALFGTIVLYEAGTVVFGSSYEPFYSELLRAAGRFSPELVRLSFVLAVLGFGTKMGLVPLHTWLPDAHSEAPTAVSALLSGALLAVSFYAILRFYQVSIRTLGPAFPRDILLGFGLASLVLSSLSLANQRDLKRLFAYSSIEHMGVLAVGMSFSTRIAVVGVLLHVLAHAAAKSTAFFGAGSVTNTFGTKDMRRIRGGTAALPWSGPMLLLAVLGLSAMPPFGLFRSEFLIVSGGLTDPKDAVAAVLLVLGSAATLGLSWFASQTMLTPAGRRPPSGTGVRGSSEELAPAEACPALPGSPPARSSAWIVAAMATGLGALALLGVHPPGVLSGLLERAARELGALR